MFDAGTKNTPPAVAAASQQYKSLKTDGADGVRVDYAYALVLANQRKYAEAIPLLMRYIRAQPTDVCAISTIAWVFVHEKRPANALAACGAFGRRFPNDPAAPPKPELAAAAELVGGLFAYLEIVRPDAVHAPTLATRKNEVLAHLSDGYLPAFDRGRIAVTARLNALETEHAQKQKQTDDLAQQKRDRTKSLLDDSKQKADVETKTIQASTEQLQDAQRELNLIQQQLSRSGRDREQLAAQIITLQAQLTQLNEFDNRQRYYSAPPMRTMQVAYAQAANVTITLAGVNKQAFELDNRILSMQQPRHRADGAPGGRRPDAPKAWPLPSRRKRATTLEKQVAREKVSKAPRKFVPVGRAANVATYVAFPYDQECARVLAWFKK